MIVTKGQLVRLTDTALLLAPEVPGGRYTDAKVLSLVYLDQPEGERGVQLDRELAGSRWWMECALEAVSP